MIITECWRSSIDKIELMAALKELVKRSQPKLFHKIREELNPREVNLLDYVFEHYYRKDKISGRWYDPYHVLFSTGFAFELVRTNQRTSPLIIPAIILHDIGYSALTDEAKANWNAFQNRIVHMQEGAGMAAKALAHVGGFNGDEIGDIVGMDASHDNLILGIPTDSPMRLALIDADRVWVMHFISFWKDFVSETGHAEDLSPLDLFQIRQPQFYSNIIPHTSLARQWRDKQFKKRLKEIQGGIMQDRSIFQKYAEKATNSKTG